MTATPTMDGGMSTWSMMCTTPLVVSAFAVMTSALLTKMLPSRFVMFTSWLSRVLTSWEDFRSNERTAALAITWYSSTDCSVLMFLGSSRWASVPLGSARKALLVGAKTVKGPLAESAVVSSPALSAVTSVDRSEMPDASSTMFFVGTAGSGTPAGSKTESMMWMTPLDAITSAVLTVASLILTPAAVTWAVTFSPSTVLIISLFVRSFDKTAPATTW